MAGGTGAGLGTRAAEVLRDEFGLVPCVKCCLWPHEGGEVLVQSYNTLLTLTHLAQVGALQGLLCCRGCCAAGPAGGLQACRADSRGPWAPARRRCLTAWCCWRTQGMRQVCSRLLGNARPGLKVGGGQLQPGCMVLASGLA
jgi:hypothetical protein